MAFTRNFLKTMGLTDEQVTAIMEEHTTVTDALKKQRDDARSDADKYKADAEKLPELTKENESLKAAENFKEKYDTEHKAFEDYKAEVTRKEELVKVQDAYKRLLQDEKISDSRIDLVMRKTDFSGMKLGKDGKLEGTDELKKAIGDDWGIFKVTTHERKPFVSTPPGGSGDSGARAGGRARELQEKFYQERYGIKQDAGKE